MAKKKPKNLGGAPTKYNPKYCEEMVAYFSKPLLHKDEYNKTTLNDFPTFQGYAVRVLNVTYQTLLNWKDEHKEFFDAYRKCKSLQETLLAEGGLSRAYDSRFAMFIMNSISDTFKEKTVTEHTIDKDTKNIIKLAYNLPDPKED